MARTVDALQFPTVLPVFVTEEVIAESTRSGGRGKRTRCPISRAVRSTLAATMPGSYDVEVYSKYGRSTKERQVIIVVRPEGTDKNPQGESDHEGLAVYNLSSFYKHKIRHFDGTGRMAPFVAEARLAA